MQFETLAYGHGLVEGPRIDEKNCLYFSDMRERKGTIFRARSEIAGLPVPKACF